MELSLKTHGLKAFALMAALTFYAASGLCAANPATPGEADKTPSDGRAKDAPRRPVSVVSDTMEAEKDKNLVIFRGNVAAQEDFILCTDELYVSYDGNNEINEITAKGNVRLFQDEKAATSDNAVYDRKARKIILTGDAVVKQCSDTVKGDRIVVFIEENKALVESEKGGRVKAVIMPGKKCTEAAQAGPEKEGGFEARCKRTR